MIPQRLLVCHVLIWSIWYHLWLGKAKPQRNCNASFIAPCRQQFVPFPVQSVTLGAQLVFLPLSPYFSCLSSSSSAHYGLLLSPANLISRLLLRMRRIYVGSIRLDFHQEWIVSLSKGVFERRTSNGSEAFPLLICLDDIKFVLLSFFTIIVTIWLRIWAKQSSKNKKGPLPVDVRRSKSV